MYALASLGAPTLLRGRRGTMCTAKGSDMCFGRCEISSFFEVQDIKNDEFCETSFINGKLNAELTDSY